MDGKGSLGWLWKALGIALLVLLLGAETLVHRHPHFQAEGSFAFFALLGAGAVIALALLARLLGSLLRRGEDYYDR